MTHSCAAGAVSRSMVGAGWEFFRSLCAGQEQGCEPQLPQWQTPGLVQPGHCCSWPSSLPDLLTTQWSARLLIRGRLTGQFGLVTAKAAELTWRLVPRERSCVLPCASLFPLPTVPCIALALGSLHPAPSQFNDVQGSYLCFFSSFAWLLFSVVLVHPGRALLWARASRRQQQQQACRMRDWEGGGILFSSKADTFLSCLVEPNSANHLIKWFY